MNATAERTTEVRDQLLATLNAHDFDFSSKPLGADAIGITMPDGGKVKVTFKTVQKFQLNLER